MVQSIWHPPGEETDAFTAAVLDAVRMRLPAHFGTQSLEPLQLGEERSVLPDGTPVVIVAVAQYSQGDEWYGRPVLRFDLAGHAARREVARRFTGHALVDTETKAFLELDVQFTTEAEVRR
ncbi:hypothetical protein [Amorphus orientalis]|uniref:Uncharacterized protein n=1 Tax=Amorphus orientalis TaxID=649198 RepID=A0AAE3VKR9_9HYPH|nr:hypothetical protein [Amorphus orientalis]MDQ0314274.1 hypothetical protein [Amorphus orientalis]